MQQALEVQTPFNKFASRRGEVNNYISALISMVNTSPESERIWTEVRQDLIRLSAGRTRDLRDLLPEQVVQSVQESELSSIPSVASTLGKHETDIHRYRMLVGTDLTVILQRKGIIAEGALVIDQAKYNQVEELHREVDVISLILRRGEVKKQLREMPDLKALLESFQRYSTVQPFLEENRVPYDPRYVSLTNLDLRDFLFGNKIPRMGQFLKRATFARWVYGHTNWYGVEQAEISTTIGRCANFVYSIEPVREKATKVRMKWFLGEIMAQEFSHVRQDLRLGYKYALDEIFIPVNGAIKTSNDIDVVKTFRSFAEASYCPATLVDIIKNYIADYDRSQTYDRLAEEMYQDLAYSVVYKKAWIKAGFMFLENALHIKPLASPGWGVLTFDRRRALREFREIFQACLPTSFKR